MTHNRFNSLDDCIAFAKSNDKDMIGYHLYAIKDGYYFAYKFDQDMLLDNEYEYLDIRKVG